MSAPPPDAGLPALDAVQLARVDALFAGEPPAPAAALGPRIQAIRAVLALGLPLSLLGIPCWTGVPGAALTLWAYSLADGAMAEAGSAAPDELARLAALRRTAVGGLVFAGLSFVVQAWLLSQPFYAGFYVWLWAEGGTALLERLGLGA